MAQINLSVLLVTMSMMSLQLLTPLEKQWGFWVMLGVLFTQFSAKASRVLLVLLALENVMLFIAFIWSMLLSLQSAAPQEVFTFFVVSVCEACLGLAVVIRLVREKGNEALANH